MVYWHARHQTALRARILSDLWIFDYMVAEPDVHARLHALEQHGEGARMGRHYYCPIRFVSREKLTRLDKLLLAFDAFAFSRATGKLSEFVLASVQAKRNARRAGRRCPSKRSEGFRRRRSCTDCYSPCPPRSKCCGPKSMGNCKKLKLIQDVEHPVADRKVIARMFLL